MSKAETQMGQAGELDLDLKKKKNNNHGEGPSNRDLSCKCESNLGPFTSVLDTSTIILQSMFYGLFVAFPLQTELLF